jgi:putative exporter of polyketide antibiotics
MIEMVGGIGAISSSVVGTSVFHHMAPAPATAPDWVAAGVLSLIGVAAAAIGFLGLGRRDLAGG